MQTWPAPSPTVAVVVVNYNGGEFLPRCLRALAQQTFAPRRVYVVDNASTDGSAETASRDVPDVSLIRLERNVGFAAANNLAIGRAQDCDWIALLNPDTFPEARWLEQLLAAAAARPEFSFFGCRMLMADDTNRLDGVGDAYHVTGIVWREGRGAPAKEAFLDAREIFSPCAAAALYRRKVFQEIGGFDEDFFCYLEDVDLGFRLRLAGYRCLYVPDAIVRHVGSASTGKESDFAVYHGHRNLVWAHVKNMPGQLFWLFLPLHIVANIYVVIRYALKWRWRVILKAKWDAIKGLRRIWAKRRSIQAGRIAGFRSLLPLMHIGLRRRFKND